MFKKFVAMIVAIAMVATMFIVPTSVGATSLTDAIVLSEDYSTGSNTAGSAVGTAVEYVTDATLGKTVASFAGDTTLVYDLGADKMDNNFTAEAYVNINMAPSGWGLMMGTFCNSFAGWGVGYGEFGNGIGTASNEISITSGNGASKSAGAALSTNKWAHVVYTNDGTNEYLYVDGVLAAQQTVSQGSYAYNSTHQFHIGSFNAAGQFGLKMKVAYLNIYDAAASASDVASLYTVATAPTPAPTPELPVGEHYTLTATEVEPFKAGDPVTVRLTVSDVKDDWSLMGLDLTIPFNNEVLEYVSATSSSEIINADYPDGEVKWELIMNTNNAADGKLLVTMLDDGDAWMGTSEDGAIWVELTFTALKDTVGGEFLLYTQYAEGTENVDLETAYGDGVYVAVKTVATPEPTASPEPTATPEPTPKPTVAPFDSTGLVVDIDFTEGFEDKAGSLTFTNDDGNGPWYTGTATLTQEFTIESYNGVNVGGFHFFGSFNCGNDAVSGLESWQVGPNVPYVSGPGSDGSLQHVVITSDGSAYSLYVDGVLVAQDTENAAQVPESFNLVASNGKLALAWNVTERNFFKVYNTAATAEDVAALYEAATYVEPTEAPTEEPVVTPEPTPVPFNSEAVVDIDFSSTVADSKGVLTCGRDASNAVYADLSAYESALKGLQLDTVHASVKYSGGADLATTDGIALEFYGVFAAGQFLGNGYYSAEVNGDGTIGFWETIVGGASYIQSNTALDLTKANHIVFVQTADTMKLYINGVLDKEVSYTQTAATLTAGELRLFAASAPYLSLFKVYQGTATDADVAALYAAIPEYVAPTPAPTPVPTAKPFDNDAKIDIDFATETDTKGVLTYAKGDLGCPWFTGDIEIGKEFTIEYMADTDAGYTLFSATYQIETYADGSFESWHTVGTNPHIVAPAGTLVDGQNHIVVVGDGSSYKMYANGVLVAEQTDVDFSTLGQTFTSGNTIAIGHGDTDRKIFRVYTTAATADNVAALYEAAQPAPKAEKYLPIITKPSKMFYEAGEELDLTGLVTGLWNADKTEYTDITADITIDSSEFNSAAEGSYRIYLTYETEDTIYWNFFTLHVKAPVTVTGVGIVTKPSKLVYNVGDEFDATGLKILVKYSDGSVAYLEGADVPVAGFDSSAAGSFLVSIEVEGKIAQFTVHVKDVAPVTVTGVGIVTKPSKTVYAVGEEFDPTGLKILVKYSDGTVEYLEGADVPVAGFDSSVANSFLVKIEVAGKIAQFTVHVR